MLRLWVWPIFLMLAVLMPGAALPHAPAQPPPSAPRIIAIGDLHGDHQAWTAIARAAGVMDAKGHWSGGRTVLVQLGDIVDRGPDSLVIIRDLMRLEKEASRRGGRVMVLVGNHEAMMMTGDLRYVHPDEYAAFVDRRSDRRRSEYYAANRKAIESTAKVRTPSALLRAAWMRATPLGMIEHRAAWDPEGELGKWTLSHAAVARIGGTLFVHGGISANYAAFPLDEINRRVAAALKAQEEGPTSIINDVMGPLWYRGLVTRADTDEAPPPAATAVPVTPRPTIEQEVDLVLSSFGVKRIVVGHTPSRAGIVSTLGGKLWRADSANSSYYGGPPSYLEINGDTLVAHKVPRPEPSPKGGMR